VYFVPARRARSANLNFSHCPPRPVRRARSAGLNFSHRRH
jgi:hypothetical protein